MADQGQRTPAHWRRQLGEGDDVTFAGAPGVRTEAEGRRFYVLGSRRRIVTIDVQVPAGPGGRRLRPAREGDGRDLHAAPEGAVTPPRRGPRGGPGVGSAARGPARAPPLRHPTRPRRLHLGGGVRPGLHHVDERRLPRRVRAPPRARTTSCSGGSPRCPSSRRPSRSRRRGSTSAPTTAGATSPRGRSSSRACSGCVPAALALDWLPERGRSRRVPRRRRGLGAARDGGRPRVAVVDGRPRAPAVRGRYFGFRSGVARGRRRRRGHVGGRALDALDAVRDGAGFAAIYLAAAVAGALAWFAMARQYHPRPRAARGRRGLRARSGARSGRARTRGGSSRSSRPGTWGSASRCRSGPNYMKRELGHAGVADRAPEHARRRRRRLPRAPVGAARSTASGRGPCCCSTRSPSR